MPRVAALHRVAARLVPLLLLLTVRATKEENMVVVVAVVKEAVLSVSFVTGSRTERPMKREKEREMERGFDGSVEA